MRRPKIDIIPYPGFIIVHRDHKSAHSQGGVWVPRQDQEETPFAMVAHPGDSAFKFKDLLVVMPHTGTDFWWDEGDMEFTFLSWETEVLGVVER